MFLYEFCFIYDVTYFASQWNTKRPLLRAVWKTVYQDFNFYIKASYITDGYNVFYTEKKV